MRIKRAPGDSQSRGGSVVTAIAIIILAIFLFDVQGALIKHMGKRYPVEQIAFFRNLFGMLPHLFILLYTTRFRLSRSEVVLARWKLGLFRGIILVGAQVCFYTAIVRMEFATATTLAFSGPLFVTLLSIPMLGHKVGWWRTFAVLLGFAGVVMVMQPGADAFSAVAFLPIAAAVCYAFVSLSSRLFQESESTALISLYATVGAIVTTLILAMAKGQWTPMETGSDWFWFIGMGMAGGCAVFCLITAYRMADPSTLSPFEYFGIPFSFFLGWIFFAETPFDSLFPGVLLIVGGGLLVIWRERQLKNVS